MFWETYSELCKQKNESPTGVAQKLGFTNAACSKWKKGTVPNGTTLKTIADYFGVTTGYLLGEKPDTPTPAAEDPLTAEIVSLAELLAKTESGLARLRSVAEDMKRMAELEQLTAELDRARAEKAEK